MLSRTSCALIDIPGSCSKIGAISSLSMGRLQDICSLCAWDQMKMVSRPGDDNEEDRLTPLRTGHGKKAHDHYFTVTKYHADRLMSLLQYVFHDGPQPNWSVIFIPILCLPLSSFHVRRVRATFTTSTSTLHPLFLDSVDATVPAGTFPPIYHATPATFTPALTESELERVESTMRQSRSWAKHVPPPAVRDAVLAREARPKAAHATWLAGKSGPEGCAYCGEVAEGKMPQCSVYVPCSIGLWGELCV